MIKFGLSLSRAGKVLATMIWIVLVFIAVWVPPGMICSPELARLSKAKQDILALSATLELFKQDYGHYPATQEGLQSLVEKHKPDSSRTVGSPSYLERLPSDPWGHPYQYRAPGIHLPASFDLWSPGEDHPSNASEESVLLGNWPGDFSVSQESFKRRVSRDLAPAHVVFSFVISLSFGMPVYLSSIAVQRLFGRNLRQAADGFNRSAYILSVIAASILPALIYGLQSI